MNDDLKQLLSRFELDDELYGSLYVELEDWHTRKLKEAVREEWKLISEVAHSANITAELYISKAREDRQAELEKEQPDDR